MKRLAKRILPAPMWSAVQGVKARSQLALVEFRADQKRYRRHGQRLESATITLTRTQLEGQLTRDYHRIEKGLALPSPKRPFGADIAKRMDVLIPIAQRVAPDAGYLHAAVTARDALRRWNERGEIDDEVAPVAPPTTYGADLALAFESRHSVRNFSAEPVSKADLDEAIRIAAYSPSVCNREPWRVRLYERSDVQRMLEHQNGNRGFADTVPVLALVSVELGYFEGVGERNQAWIDGGGLFLHARVGAAHARPRLVHAQPQPADEPGRRVALRCRHARVGDSHHDDRDRSPRRWAPLRAIAAPNNERTDRKTLAAPDGVR